MKKLCVVLALGLTTPLLHTAEVKEKESKATSEKKYSDEATIALDKALQKLDVQGVKNALEHGANPNGRINPKTRSVTTNPKEGISIILNLLEATAGTFINSTVKQAGEEVLVKDLFAAILDVLVQYGIDLDQEIKVGEISTPLIDIISNRRLHSNTTLYVVEDLIRNGASINYQDSNGETALVAAAKNTNPFTLEILLNHGAETSILGKDGKYHNIREFPSRSKTLLEGILREYNK